MNFRDFITALQKCGSDEDPIWVDGKETTPRNLSYNHGPLDNIGHIRIAFYGGEPHRKIRGTLHSMLRERQTMP